MFGRVSVSLFVNVDVQYVGAHYALAVKHSAIHLWVTIFNFTAMICCPLQPMFELQELRSST